MIAAWMAYAVLIGGLAGIAAFALEYALRLNGRAGRSVWATAMAVTVVAPASVAWWRYTVAEVVSQTVSAGSAEMSTLRSLGELAVTPTPFLQHLNVPLMVLWGIVSLVAALMLAGGVARLRTRRRLWAHRVIDGTDVLVSEDFGPALVGVTRPEIVLPQWALDLSPQQRSLVVAHESEHRAKRDTQLLASGVFAALLMPWNLPLLWHLRRLRRAVEMDCDARVLRRGVSPATYGELLLRMGTHRGHSVPLVAALTEPRTLLEGRIRMITRSETQGRVKKTMMALALATVVIAVACDAPAPTQIAEQAQTPAQFTRPHDGQIESPGEAIARAAVGSPLIVVDGVITGWAISELDALDIASIEVIKGGVAEALYGTRGANGIIQITTKAAAVTAEFTVTEVDRGPGVVVPRKDRPRQ